MTFWPILGQIRQVYPCVRVWLTLPSRVTLHDLTWPRMTFDISDIPWYPWSQSNASYGSFQHSRRLQSHIKSTNQRFLAQNDLLTPVDLTWRDLGNSWPGQREVCMGSSVPQNFISVTIIVPEILGGGTMCPPPPPRRSEIKGPPRRVLSLIRKFRF